VAEAPQVEIAGFAWKLDPSADVGRAMLAASRRLREAGVDSPQLDKRVADGSRAGCEQGLVVRPSGP